MKSRNPAITPSEIKSILLNSKNFSLPIKAHPDMIKDNISQQYLVDVKKAVLDAITDSNHKKAAQSYKGMIVNNGSSPKEIHFNRSIVMASGVTVPDAEKFLGIPFQMVSNYVWNTILANNQFVDSSGWSNIRAGIHFFNANQIEVLDANPVTLKPEIQIISFSPSTPGSTAGFKMTLTGKDLFADTRNVPESKLQIIFKDIDPAKPEIRIDYTDVNPLPAQASGTDFIQNYIGLDHVLNAKNDGTLFELKIPGGVVPPARYKIFFSSQVSNQRSLTVAGDFGVASVGSDQSDGSSNINSLATVKLANTLTEISLWLLRGSSKVFVEPGQEVGIGINYPNLAGVDIQIDGQSMPIRQLANNYLTFGIPSNMIPGAKDVIIKLAGGQVTLEQALEIISLAGLPKVSFAMPENTIYSNGQIWKDIYVTIRNGQEQRLLAGNAIYIRGLGTPVQPNQQLMDPTVGNETVWNTEGLFYTDANGEIHFKYKVDGSLFQEAYRYGALWPTPDSPNTRFRVCTYTYRSSKPGWGGDCLEQLFPSNSEPSNEGRIFWVGPASARIEPAHMDMVMNGSTYAMSITDVRDKAGNIVPDGTSVYLAYPYWITMGSGGMITPEEGQSYYVQSGGRLFARLVVRGGRANFTVTTRSIACWGGNEVTRDSLTLVGTFNSSVDNPLNRIATGTIQYLEQRCN